MSDVTLANYLGPGSNPNLTMVLGKNAPGWKTYNLNYQGIGSIPWSDDSTAQWSTWDVVDENANYYGTITLNCSSTAATWVRYEAGTRGYYLVDIQFGPVQGKTGAYQLTVQQIIRPAQTTGGPFSSAPLATPAVHPRTSQPIVLTTNGARIVNDQDNTVLLKGVVRPSLEWNSQGQYLGASDIAAMHSWGANCIRIPLNQVWWIASQPRTTTGSYKQIVDAMIYYAIQQGMAVILDLHKTDTSETAAPMANQDSITFWQDVAKTYAGFGTVLFELHNEPVNISEQQWLSGGGGYVGYQQLYNAVRQAGANNLCIVGGLDWAYKLDFVSKQFCVQGGRRRSIARTRTLPGALLPNGPSFAANFAGVLGTFPVIFTEFGGNNATTYRDLDYYKAVISYVNANKFHYTAFAWWVEAAKPEFPTLIGDWGGTPINGGADRPR